MSSLVVETPVIKGYMWRALICLKKEVCMHETLELSLVSNAGVNIHVCTGVQNFPQLAEF